MKTKKQVACPQCATGPVGQACQHQTGSPLTTHTPTLGESLDHYGEEYCTRAVNAHEELILTAKVVIEQIRKCNSLIPAVDALYNAVVKAEAR